MEETLYCSCGHGSGPNHILSEGNCCRKKATGNLIPTNFRKEKWFDWKEPYDVCDVNGYSITVFTLKQQRGYSQHSNGDWSLPKSEESITSLDAFHW
jgi:hypothetical protein